MSEQELSKRVQSWVENTGLPLELDAKSAFKKAGFYVSHSTLYVDPETEKGREIDIVAYHRDPIGLIQSYFVIECKASGDPWVVLTDLSEFPQPINYSLGLMSSNVRPSLPDDWQLPRSPLGNILHRLHAGGYALKQAFSKQNDAAYGAAISVLKASRAVIAQEPGATERYKAAFPVIVVDAPIFECRMGETGQLHFREVPYSEVRFTAYVPELTTASIRIVRRQELKYFAKNCAALSEAFEASLAYKVGEWIEEKRASAKAKESPGAAQG